MKLLFDQNLSYKLCRALGDLFPDSEQVRLLGLDQAGDHIVWDRARVDGFMLVTQDADYAELAGLRGSPPKVIWLRCGNQPTDVVEKLLRDHYEAIVQLHEDDDAACLELFL